MKLKSRNFLLLIVCMCAHSFFSLSAQTIAEKKAGITGGASELNPEMRKFLIEINKELKSRQEELHRYQDQVSELFVKNAPEGSYKQLLVKINNTKENIRILQESWREMATKPGKHDEGYALWHQPETTLEQLVIDYGSLDYVYVIPPEIGKIDISIASNIPIPLSSWGEMLEQILLQSGVGIRTLNPYLRALYLVQDDFSSLRLITSDSHDLEAYPSNARVGFVLTPEPLDVKRIWYFLEKFMNPNTTVLQRIGRAILIVGEVSSVKDLLRIYHFVAKNKRELEYKAVPLHRVDAEEMAKILAVVFEELVQESNTEEAVVEKGSKKKEEKSRKSASKSNEDINALNVIALPKLAQAVFLIGTKEEIARAEGIIREVESQVGQARDKSIFWYNVKHSDPEEIAQVMEKIYFMMVENRVGAEKAKEKRDEENKLKSDVAKEDRLIEQQQQNLYQNQVSQPYFFAPPYYQQGGYVVNPQPIGPQEVKKKEYNRGRENFIVDPKTGSLVMVVETDLIPKMTDVLKKLDVPKRMVQIDVLLFERSVTKQTNYGLNLLKLGSAASRTNLSAAVFDGDGTGSVVGSSLIPNYTPIVGSGIFEFFYSCKSVPIDFAYKFMMSQDNVSLNASPSVVTMNQTEAIIAIKDEKSILVGTVFPESNSGTAAQDAYTRAQYGIQITVTPTVHIADDRDFFSDPQNYVTLVSQINFDTFPAGQENSQQPTVNRRQIVNEVRIPDGQSVIIGGLRRRQTSDTIERVPFLGEIPGIGKLFSQTALTDEDTELIVFMTPKIISDPAKDFVKLRTEHLCQRPGDLPEFMHRLNAALDYEQNRMFGQYLEMMLGRPKQRFICEGVEYDGR